MPTALRRPSAPRPLGLLALLGVAALAPPAARAATPAPLRAGRGVVAADHPLASQAGVELLRRGGNAVDAACATALALGVVSPASSGLGGGGFMVLHLARPAGAGRGEPGDYALDFRERAPRAATPDLFSRPGGAPDASVRGGLAIAVPGQLSGLAEAVRRFGRLPLAACVEPAARLAARGFPVSRFVADRLAELARSSPPPAVAAALLPGGRALPEGGWMRRPDLARTLAAIRRAGPDALYRGPLGREIVAATRAAGGLLDAQDLADYRPVWRAPLEGSYRGRRIVTMPPPSSGGVALVEALNVLEATGELAPLGFGSSAHLHRVAEALKHAFADRSRLLGDPDFVKVPTERLTDKGYARALAARLGDERVLPRAGYGGPEPEAAPPRDGGTSHFSVIDGQGNAVGLTTTINRFFGATVVAGRTGVVLNDEMDDFTVRPGQPNAFGLVQGPQNAIAPGKRPLSSMAPTIVLAPDGRAELVLGGSGGPRIISAVLAVLVGVVDFGLDVAAAVDAPRVHAQWLPEELSLEAEVVRDVAEGLARRGHKVVRAAPYERAVVQAAQARADGAREAASDPRKDGVPAGL